jgi:hypothetical protein
MENSLISRVSIFTDKIIYVTNKDFQENEQKSDYAVRSKELLRPGRIRENKSFGHTQCGPKVFGLIFF